MASQPQPGPSSPPYYHYTTHSQPHPYPQHQPQHPNQPYAQPQPYPSYPQQHYPHPSPVRSPVVFQPAWHSQPPLSPLPKQLFMPPPVVEPLTNVAYARTGTIPMTATARTASTSSTPPRNTTSSDSSPTAPRSRSLGGWAIWSRRPEDPAHAPGIIISPNAKPPPNVVQRALELRTPPPSPSPLPLHDIELASNDAPTPSAPSSTVPSSSVTDVTDTPGSPVSSSTSLSASGSAAGTPAKDAAKEDAVLASPVASVPPPLAASEEPSEAAPQPQQPDATPQTHPEPAIQIQPESISQAPQPAKKSWASLLQTPTSPGSSTQKPRNALPTSSVVGISIPASSTSSTAPTPQVFHPKRTELLALLTSAPPPAVGGFASAVKSSISTPQQQQQERIRPRGLINAGNMCFANSVLQVLVYCPPFRKLFVELGRVGIGAVASGEKEKEGKEGMTPLVNATVEFVKEFVVSPPPASAPKVNGRSVGPKNGNGNGKGKGRDEEYGGKAQDEWEDGESFIPSYVYDAMKENKRFDNMRSGQQEDAEEFLGFYLDTLEEELLALVNSLSTPAPSAKALQKKAPLVNGKVVEVEGQAEKEDGWLEVGKRNRMVVTRTIKSTESPITRIFGGKFRSTLKVPGQKDSVVVEDWRALRLDIQRDDVNTIQDALSHISDPQTIHLSHPAREASQQVLIEALPQILVVHLKRFCYDVQVGGVVKVAKEVRFAPELEIGSDIMAPAMRRAQPTKYKLFGVLYHHGQSASGGHYTLDILHPTRYPASSSPAQTQPSQREGWIRIDDELVSDVRPDDVFALGSEREREEDGRCAYLLFYRRIR